MTGSDRQVVLDKTWRDDIAALIKRIRKASGRLQPGEDSTRVRSSRERSTVLTKLQEAAMWIDADLKDIDENTPGSV